jgi:hypothetical protein
VTLGLHPLLYLLPSVIRRPPWSVATHGGLSLQFCWSVEFPQSVAMFLGAAMYCKYWNRLTTAPSSAWLLVLLFPRMYLVLSAGRSAVVSTCMLLICLPYCMLVICPSYAVLLACSMRCSTSAY